ncbi:hypothetical protein GCM10010987_79980 [Bradyrhizobium guangdongense]|uniref:Uncharacterized protein n=1 Tax=Bradyrhizobium guangdongense TaxID=1325090 RepID=A0AA88BCZ1_9BRAD|nr:hypothetical protein GCM10010987_79980 [Bradyrhizobium guangdongense]
MQIQKNQAQTLKRLGREAGCVSLQMHATHVKPVQRIKDRPVVVLFVINDADRRIGEP